MIVYIVFDSLVAIILLTLRYRHHQMAMQPL